MNYQFMSHNNNFDQVYFFSFFRSNLNRIRFIIFYYYITFQNFSKLYNFSKFEKILEYLLKFLFHYIIIYLIKCLRDISI